MGHVHTVRSLRYAGVFEERKHIMSTRSRSRTTFAVIFAIAIVSLFAWSGSLVPAHAEGDALPETFDIDYEGKKAAVTFPHAAHFEIADCTDCHHTKEGLTLANVADMNVQKCGDCHLEPEEDGVPVIMSASSKKNAFHINCISCHKDSKKENAEISAPTKCNDCHPKD